jgi:hypothetical protein
MDDWDDVGDGVGHTPTTKNLHKPFVICKACNLSFSLHPIFRGYMPTIIELSLLFMG